MSISGLARGGVIEPLTSAQIDELKASSPDRLQRERAIHAEVKKEATRLMTADVKRSGPRT